MINLRNPEDLRVPQWCPIFREKLHLTGNYVGCLVCTCLFPLGPLGFTNWSLVNGFENWNVKCSRMDKIHHATSSSADISGFTRKTLGPVAACCSTMHVVHSPCHTVHTIDTMNLIHEAAVEVFQQAERQGDSGWTSTKRHDWWAPWIFSPSLPPKAIQSPPV